MLLLLLFLLFLLRHSVMCNSLWPHQESLAHQVPLSMGFPRHEYWIRLPFPSSGDFPDPGIELASSALAGGLFITMPPGKPRSRWEETINKTKRLLSAWEKIFANEATEKRLIFKTYKRLMQFNGLPWWFSGKESATSDMQMAPPLRQKTKKN